MSSFHESILVPLDGSALGEYALPLALGIARRSGATLHLVHVCTQPPADAAAFNRAMFAPHHQQACAEAEHYLNDMAARLGESSQATIQTQVLEGPEPLADVLEAHAEAIGAVMIVLTTHVRGGLTRLWMGSVADRLLRRTRVPLLLTRPQEHVLELAQHLSEPGLDHILIPLDGSRRAEDAIKPALALGSLANARYTLLQAIEPLALGFAPTAGRVSEQFLQEWHANARTYLESIAAPLRHAGNIVATHTVALPAALAIVEGAQQYRADMIVMSSHGRSGVARLLLGSVADKVVRSATVPVFIQPVHTVQADLDAELAAQYTHDTAHAP